jgi:hypothetical protein
MQLINWSTLSQGCLISQVTYFTFFFCTLRHRNQTGPCRDGGDESTRSHNPTRDEAQIRRSLTWRHQWSASAHVDIRGPSLPPTRHHVSARRWGRAPGAVKDSEAARCWLPSWWRSLLFFSAIDPGPTPSLPTTAPVWGPDRPTPRDRRRYPLRGAPSPDRVSKSSRRRAPRRGRFGGNPVTSENEAKRP